MRSLSEVRMATWSLAGTTFLMVRAACPAEKEGTYHVHLKTEMIISYMRAKNAEGLKTQVRMIHQCSINHGHITMSRVTFPIAP